MDSNISKEGCLQIIDKMVEILDKGWCQGKYTTKKNGELCDPEDPLATNYCLSGALFYACKILGLWDYPNHLEFIWISRAVVDSITKSPETYFMPSEYRSIITTFNDDKDRKKEEVISVVKGAKTYLNHIVQ